MTELRYLHVFGGLGENMTYRPEAGSESAWPGQRRPGDPSYALILADRADRELLRVAPEVVAEGCGYVTDPRQFWVSGVLPLHPDATVYELRRGEIRLYRRTIPPSPPSVPRPRCRLAGNRIAISWAKTASKGRAASHRRDRNTAYGLFLTRPVDAISYDIVAAMDAGRHVAIATGLTRPGYEVDLGLLPVAGKGRLFLVANDGVRSSRVEACAIDVPERPPTVHILDPVPDARLPYGQPLSLLGCCLDMGGEPCPAGGLIWSLNGRRFAAGTAVAVLDKPPPGRHVLALAYRGKGRLKAEASMIVEIEEPDEAFRQWERLIRECFPAEG